MTNSIALTKFSSAKFGSAKSGLLKSGEGSFLQYLREIQKFPLLTAEEEFEYGVRFFNHGDKEAAKMLVQSHLRLVVKMASKFKSEAIPTTQIALRTASHKN